MKLRDFPEEGELVVGTVSKVQNFGALVALEEYSGKEGFCHIREVAPGWVKRIRDHVREQQRVVCKVFHVDERKGHIDLSLKAVNDHQRRETIQSWKNEQKAEKFVQMLAEREGSTVEEIVAGYGGRLMEVFGTMYQAFQEAAEYGEEVFKEEEITGDWIPAFVAFAKENIQAQFVEIDGYMSIESHAPNGVELVQEALLVAEDSEFEDVEIHVAYKGAPYYRVNVRAPDFKIAEEQLRIAADRSISRISELGGSGEFQRELEAKK